MFPIMATTTFKLDLRGLTSGLDRAARKQLPFAAAGALNDVARAGIAAERLAMTQELDRPRPFTAQQGLRLAAASKGSLIATVYIPQIQSRYLAPEILGGAQVLNAGAVLRPIDQATDRYGNLPRGLVARLKARRDVFIGAVRGVEGVWQRLPGHRLRLLIRFSAPVEVKTRYRFGAATIAAAKAGFAAALRARLRQALATAR